VTKARRREKKADAKKLDDDADADSIGINKLLLLLPPLELAAAPLDARRARAASTDAPESQRLDIADSREEKRRESEPLPLFSSSPFVSPREKWLAALTLIEAFRSCLAVQAPASYYARFDGLSPLTGDDETFLAAPAPASSEGSAERRDCPRAAARGCVSPLASLARRVVVVAAGALAPRRPRRRPRPRPRDLDLPPPPRLRRRRGRRLGHRRALRRGPAGPLRLLRRRRRGARPAWGRGALVLGARARRRRARRGGGAVGVLVRVRRGPLVLRRAGGPRGVEDVQPAQAGAERGRRRGGLRRLRAVDDARPQLAPLSSSFFELCPSSSSSSSFTFFEFLVGLVGTPVPLRLRRRRRRAALLRHRPQTGRPRGPQAVEEARGRDAPAAAGSGVVPRRGPARRPGRAAFLRALRAAAAAGGAGRRQADRSLWRPDRERGGDGSLAAGLAGPRVLW